MEKEVLGFVVVLHSISQSSVMTSPFLYGVAPEDGCFLPPKSSAIYSSCAFEKYLVGFRLTPL